MSPAEALPQLLAVHPFAAFACGASVVLAIVSLIRVVGRRARGPLGTAALAAWRRGTRVWPLLSRLPQGWWSGPLLLDLVLVWILVLAAMAVFLVLARQIGLDAGLVRFDDALVAALAREAPPATLKIFAAITRLADAEVQWAIGTIVGLVLLVRRRVLLTITWIAAVAGNGLLNRALKALFERTRPLHEHGLVMEHGWSFPSGHTSGAVVIYGMLAYLATRAMPAAWHLPMTLLAVMAMLLVGYSRVVLQVHYFSDVLAAYLSGGAWLLACIGAASLVRAHRAHQASREP